MSSDVAYAYGYKEIGTFTFDQPLPFRIGPDCENEGVIFLTDYTVLNDDGTVKFKASVGDHLLSCNAISLQGKSFAEAVCVLDETVMPFVVTFEHCSTKWFYNHVLSLEASIIHHFGAVGNRMLLAEYLELEHKDRLFLVNKVKEIFEEAMQLAHQKAQGIYEL